MLSQGAWTEDFIASIGGRDALKSIPPTTQIYYYVPVDGYLLVLVGTYYHENEKQVVCDLMTLIAQTGSFSD